MITEMLDAVDPKDQQRKEEVWFLVCVIWAAQYPIKHSVYVPSHSLPHEEGNVLNVYTQTASFSDSRIGPNILEIRQEGFQGNFVGGTKIGEIHHQSY